MLARRIGTFASAMMAISLLLSSSTAAQSLNRQRPGTTVEGFAQSPFDPSVEKLPPDYRGHDSKELIAALMRRASQSVKDEFETTEQFRQRVKALEASPLFGGLTIGSLLAFVIDGVETHYDADREVMSVGVNPQNVPGGVKYVNSWSPGGVRHVNLSNPGASEVPQLREELKMDVTAARAAKQNLRALVVVALKAPYYTQSGYAGAMTAELREVWLYDSATGLVFKKLKSEELKAAAERANRAKADAAKARVSRAKELFENGSDDEALMELRDAVRDEPMNAEAYLLTGRIYQRRGETAAAINMFKTAVFWDKNLIDAHILLGRIFLERGDRAQALAYSQSAMQIDPNNPEALKLSNDVTGRK